jgi:hypothetical protein
VSLPVRITALLVAFAAVVVGAAFIVVHFLLGSPPTVSYSASGGVVNVVLQEDPQNNTATQPQWVSYYVQDPTSKQWVHTTLFSIPKGTTVHMTILGYDGCTPLRNNFWSQVQGTIGRAHLRDPGPEPVHPGRLAERHRLGQQPVRHLTLHVRAPRRRDVQLQGA